MRKVLLRATIALLFAIAITAENDASLNFLAIGDWGGVGSVPFLGDWPWNKFVQQRAVAQGMATVAKDLDPAFVIALGDNFYFKGIGGSRPYDRVQKTFEDVYSDVGHAPWYVIAGNHDHYGNVTDQIDYTYYSRNKAQKDPNHIHRWEFPALYHKQSFRKGEVSVDLILIDTVVLVDAFVHWYDRWVPAWYRDKRLAGLTHWDWLEQALAESTADYLLVGGHFPVFSEGRHGPTNELVEQLKPLLEHYGAHYLSGHDHAMMHYQQQGNGTHYIVTGTGNTCCTKRDKNHQKQHEQEHSDIPLLWHLFAQDNDQGVKGGFVSFQTTPALMKVQYHDHQGKVLYEPQEPILPRRQVFQRLDVLGNSEVE